MVRNLRNSQVRPLSNKRSSLNPILNRIKPVFNMNQARNQDFAKGGALIYSFSLCLIYCTYYYS